MYNSVFLYYDLTKTVISCNVHGRILSTKYAKNSNKTSKQELICFAAVLSTDQTTPSRYINCSPIISMPRALSVTYIYPCVTMFLYIS